MRAHPVGWATASYAPTVATVRKPRLESQAETREHLLDAAGPLFEIGGFHRTSVAEIARAAGYTTGAIYSNFPRKEDLALAVIERGSEADWERLDIELAKSTDLADRLVAVITWRRRLLVANEPIGILHLELCLYALQDPELRAALVASHRDQQDRVARILERVATEAGSTLSVDSGVLAAALLATADGTAIVHSLDPSSNQAEAFAWTLATLVANAMRPRPVTDEAWPGFVDRLLAAAVGPQPSPR